MRVVLQSDRASHWLVMAAAPLLVFSLKVTLLAADGTRCLPLLHSNMSLHAELLLSSEYTLHLLVHLRREGFCIHFLERCSR